MHRICDLVEALCASAAGHCVPAAFDLRYDNPCLILKAIVTLRSYFNTCKSLAVIGARHLELQSCDLLVVGIKGRKCNNTNRLLAIDSSAELTEVVKVERVAK